MTAPLKQFLQLLGDDAAVDLAPVAIGALQTLQKSPGLLGVAAAKAYLLGNAPAALLKLESDFTSQAVNALQNDLTNLQAQAAAAAAALVKASASAAPPAS